MAMALTPLRTLSCSRWCLSIDVDECLLSSYFFNYSSIDEMNNVIFKGVEEMNNVPFQEIQRSPADLILPDGYIVRLPLSTVIVMLTSSDGLICGRASIRLTS